MGFQQTVAMNQGFGVIGEIVFEGPLKAQPGVLKLGAGGAVAADLVVGRYFTLDPTDGLFQPGGGIGPNAEGGILSNPKEYASLGTAAGGPLAPTLVLPANSVGDFVTMVTGMVVAMAAACNIGDRVLYNLITGLLSTVAPNAIGVGSIATTVLTITAVTPGQAPFAIGQRVTGPNIQADTYITSLGTGVGGVGTYNVNVSQTAASAAVTAEAVAPTGTAFVPGNAKVVRYSNAAAGLAVISANGT